MEIEGIFKNYSSLNHLSLKQKRQMMIFLQSLKQWNKVYNLTAITKLSDIVICHLLDSLSLLPYLTGRRVLDLGSGAGLPGIPLAIACPRKYFVLLDSNGKKTRFCQQMKVALSLAHVEVVQARAQDWKTDNGFDHIVTRAVAKISEIMSISRHLCCLSGSFLVMKGKNPIEELSVLQAGIAYSVHQLKVPGLNAKRHVVRIDNA